MGWYGPGDLILDGGNSVLQGMIRNLGQLIDNLIAAGVNPVDGSVTDDSVAADAAIAQTKIAGLVAALAALVAADTTEATTRAAADTAESSARTAADALLIPLAQKAAANGVATLGADSKIPGAQLPSLAIGETFVVTSQAAMLALTAQRGDIAVRTELNPDGFFLLTSDSPSTLADWVQVTAPGAVVSVNGQTGAVDLSGSYIATTGADTKTGALTLIPTSAATVPQIIKGAASQTADHFQFQDSAGLVLGAFSNKNQTFFGVGGHESGRGSLVLRDRVSNRSIELGFYQYGCSITTVSGSTDPLEFFIYSGVMSIRNNNATTPASHRLEVRQPDDAPGINIESGYKYATNTGSNSYGAWIYDDFNASPRRFHFRTNDGTGLDMYPGGQATFGGRFGPSANDTLVRVLAPTTTTQADVAMGWYDPGATNDNVTWRLRMVAGGRKVGLVYCPAATETAINSLWLTDDPRMGYGIKVPLARVDIRATETVVPVLSMWAAASQTADHQQWNDSTGATLASVGAVGRMRAADGTLAAPGHTFQSEQGSGLYRAGAGDVRLAVLGVDQVRANGSQVLVGTGGTVSAPGLAFTGDSDTGLYLFGANALNIATGGADAIWVNNTQQVGIGVTPGAKFHVSGTSVPVAILNHATDVRLQLQRNGTSVFLIDHDGTTCTVGTQTSTPIVVTTGGTVRGRWPSAGGLVVGQAAIATGATTGFLYIPTCAGTPTGVPATESSTAAVVYDTTNNQLCVYNGGWKKVTLA